MNLTTILVIIFVILFLFNNSSRQVEGFGTPTEYDVFNSLEAAEEGVPAEYQEVVREYPRGVWRHHELNSLMFERRLPTMVDHRYSYNDQEGRSVLPKEGGGAYLRDLPLDLRNRQYAVLDKDTARTSMEFWPLTQPKVKPWPVIQSSMRTIRPLEKTNKNLLIDTKYKVDRLARDSIAGYDPWSILPANYADRSKTSSDYRLAANLHDDDRNEPVRGWLPFEQ